MSKPPQKYVYVNINEQTILLLLISNVLGISKYQMLLLYETFGNDVFIFFDILQKANILQGLSQFRIKRCAQYAYSIAPVCKGEPVERLSTTELRAYKSIANYLFEDKFRIPEDREIKELE